MKIEFTPDSFRKELTERIIPYWNALKDEKNGGWCGYVGLDLTRDWMADKGCILHSRILWFYSNAYMLLGDKSLLENAQHAYRFVRENCIDRENGGIYWSVTYDGAPSDTTKHTYNQAFSVYALSSYYIASGDENALNEAKALFETIESRCRDDGGYLEAFDREWNTDSNEKLSENGVMATRTMNTLLHIIEAYTELLRAGCGDAEKPLRKALDIAANKLYNPEKKRLEVFFDGDMNSIIDLHSYGHDIEAAWLIDRACEVLGDDGVSTAMRPICAALEDTIINTAFDGRCLLNECCNGEVDKWRIWWGQAEGVVGFCNAWQKRPDRTDFIEAAGVIWQYINDTIIDKRPGSEWLWEVDKDANPNEKREMSGEWKCPYHNGRMCIEIIRRLEK
ncbi:MAG: AGE family epimerase/isomerase [Clostridia bacterium]|nr:AGE family epimerase/isomerase [Clostridia bacterium]